MKLDWITAQLNMGTRAGICRLAAESRKCLAANRALRREVETTLKRAILNGWPLFNRPRIEGEYPLALRCFRIYGMC